MGWKKGTMVSVRVSTDIHKKLQEHKERTGASIVYTIEKALIEYFEKLEGK